MPRKPVRKVKQEECCCEEGMPPGMGWRVALSTGVGIAWVMFLVTWLFFFADKYSIYQNIGIFILSILAVAVILGPAWAYWGMKYGKRWEKR